MKRTSNWSNWIEIKEAKLPQRDNGPFNHLGIYQICAVNSKGKQIPIPRLAGVDKTGVIYIGRSGFSNQRTYRTIAVRIREFDNKQHSGGITYAKAEPIINKRRRYKKHRLQVRAKFLSTKEDICAAELHALSEYHSKYGELPPCNSTRPKS
ncbi:MAG: hypothetical protein JXM79_19975 [Sedimentisphaerales bacterium]|nr:hypothetical protein [Sedimentisphaerales bacterium]